MARSKIILYYSVIALTLPIINSMPSWASPVDSTIAFVPVVPPVHNCENCGHQITMADNHHKKTKEGYCKNCLECESTSIKTDKELTTSSEAIPSTGLTSNILFSICLVFSLLGLLSIRNKKMVKN